MMTNYRSSLVSYQEASTAGLIPRLPPATLTAWADKLNITATKTRALATAATGEGSASPTCAWASETGGSTVCVKWVEPWFHLGH
jgi:hypothetical protein